MLSCYFRNFMVIIFEKSGKYSFHNLQMGPIRCSFTLHQAGRACQGQTLYLTELILRLRRKRSVLNMTLVILVSLARRKPKSASLGLALLVKIGLGWEGLLLLFMQKGQYLSQLWIGPLMKFGNQI
jgi:hypothetical protein